MTRPERRLIQQGVRFPHISIARGLGGCLVRGSMGNYRIVLLWRKVKTVPRGKHIRKREVAAILRVAKAEQLVMAKRKFRTYADAEAVEIRASQQLTVQGIVISALFNKEPFKRFSSGPYTVWCYRMDGGHGGVVVIAKRYPGSGDHGQLSIPMRLARRKKALPLCQR